MNSNFDLITHLKQMGIALQFHLVTQSSGYP